MSASIVIKTTATVLGYTFPRTKTETADGVLAVFPTVSAAKTGTLTTRTDANTGTLTMSGGHGITTGARLDLYWTGGMRRGITVGTVSTNSVPFDLGSGDDLPTNNTAITAMVPNSETFVCAGNDVVALAIFSDQPGQIVFCESDETEVKAYEIGSTSTSGEQAFTWSSDSDPDNPLSGGDIAKVYFSHSSSSDSANMRAIVLKN